MMTVARPIQLCSVYMLSIGGVAKLCESNAAFKPIDAKTRAETMMMACMNFSFLFRSLRKTR